MSKKPESVTPVPLRPPHRPVERRLEEARGQFVPVERPILPSDGRFAVASFAVAQAGEVITTPSVALPVVQRTEAGYL
jgi:hypothetical protein